MRKVTILMAILAVLCCVGTVSAQRVVGWGAAGQTDVNIQSAVNALAVTGGTIDVDPTYNPILGLESFPVCVGSTGALLIQGRFYPGVPTVIPGNGSDKIFCVMTPNVTIYGLEFTNAGFADGNCGSPLGSAGAIYIAPGGTNATVDNCLFYLNNILGVTHDGACIYVDTTTTPTIINSGFYVNQAGRSGGAIFVEASTDVTIGNNDIAENIAHTLDGGGIAWWDNSDGLIQLNDIWLNQTLYGGGISIVGCNNAPTLVDNNWITSNTAVGVLPCPFNGGHGGGIYIENSDQTVQVLNVNTITSNTAEFFGGGIATVASFGVPCSPQILNNEIYVNHVVNACAIASGGGGISVFEDADTYPVHPLIQGNHIYTNDVTPAAFGGGGIGVFYGAAQIEDNLIEYNQALNGGGIAAMEAYWVSMGPPLGMQDNVIRHNVASSYGGGIELYYSDPYVDRNNVDQNGTLSWDGGGLDAYDSDPILRSNNFTRNAAGSGTGMGVSLDAWTQIGFFNNTVADNGLVIGWDAVAIWDTTDMENNIIANQPTIDGVYEYGGDQTVTAVNNLFWNNWNNYYDGGLAAYVTMGVLNGIGGNSGNFTGNPLLDGTYHLSSNLSAAYDAGVDLTGFGVTDDIDQESRPLGAAFEVGSDELAPPPGVRDWVLY